jgi:hypothetical protein
MSFARCCCADQARAMKWTDSTVVEVRNGAACVPFLYIFPSSHLFLSAQSVLHDVTYVATLLENLEAAH